MLDGATRDAALIRREDVPAAIHIHIHIHGHVLGKPICCLRVGRSIGKESYP